ncbi:MFS general substrate transporter [Trametopsis cervina]|nr:MFS general substrate transporter [Trametopsis cervina]
MSSHDVSARTSHEADERTIQNGSGVLKYDEKTDVDTERIIEDVDDFPDGGFRAWLVVFGVLAGSIATFGFVNAWGVFQAYYEQNTLKDLSPSTIAWIGSIQYSLIFLPGLVVGKLFDRGILKVPLAISSVLLTVATLLVAECHEYWQFLLCQGFALGLSAGVAFGPLPAAISHWFKRRRGLGLGMMALGSSIGGTLFPVAVRNLIDEVGFKWTMRILALIVFVLMVVTNLTVVGRLPPKKDLGPFFDIREFKSVVYSLYCLSAFVAFLGLYTVQTYIDVSASAAGVDSNFSFYLLSISNAGSAVGRIIAGPMVDSWGGFNVLIPYTFVCGAMTFGWPFIKSKGGFIAIGLVYGACSGVYAAMITAPIFTVGRTENIGLRIGMFFSILAFGAMAGPPISGAINNATGNFKATGYFAGMCRCRNGNPLLLLKPLLGSTVMCSVAIMIACRQLRSGGKLRGKV